MSGVARAVEQDAASLLAPQRRVAERVARDLLRRAPGARTPRDVAGALGARVLEIRLPRGLLGATSLAEPDLVLVKAGLSVSETAFVVAHELMHLYLGAAAAPTGSAELEAQCDAGAATLVDGLRGRMRRLSRACPVMAKRRRRPTSAASSVC